MIKLISCLLILITSSLAFAVKERGGGNVAANGSLSELQMDEGATELSRQTLDGYLKIYSDRVATALPLLNEILLRTESDYQSRWLVEVRPLQTKGCTMNGKTTVACQVVDLATSNAVIRISGAYWKKATPLQRSQLVLHEHLRTYMFRRGYQCNTCLFAAVQAFDADASDLQMYLHNLSDTLYTQNFGVYLEDSTKKLVLIAAHQRLQSACADAPEKFQADVRSVVNELSAQQGPQMRLADRALLDVLRADETFTHADCASLDEKNSIALDGQETAATAGPPITDSAQ